MALDKEGTLSPMTGVRKTISDCWADSVLEVIRHEDINTSPSVHSSCTKLQKEAKKKTGTGPWSCQAKLKGVMLSQLILDSGKNQIFF